MKLKAVPGLEVSLRIAGVTQEEYDDDAIDSETDKLTGVKYVEAISGSNFGVFVKSDNDTGYGTISSISLDGRRGTRSVLSTRTSRTFRVEVKGRTCSVSGQGMLQKFAFAELSTDEGDLKGLKSLDLKHLGEVKINLHHVSDVSEPRPGGSSKPLEPPIRKSVPEKALKGKSISNQTTLGKPSPTGRLHTTCDVKYPFGNVPFASFVFKYRSRRNLQVEGIIPRSPSPMPLEERDPDDLSRDEARELVRRLRTQKGDNERKIKKEKRDHATLVEDDHDDDDSVTETRDRKRSRPSPDSGIEIVDLSED